MFLEKFPQIDCSSKGSKTANSLPNEFSSGILFSPASTKKTNDLLLSSPYPI